MIIGCGGNFCGSVEKVDGFSSWMLLFLYLVKFSPGGGTLTKLSEISFAYLFLPAIKISLVSPINHFLFVFSYVCWQATCLSVEDGSCIHLLNVVNSHVALLMLVLATY